MNILTFDIEDWFHFLDHPSTEKMKDWGNFPSRLDQGIKRILRLLADTNSKATFFCLGWVAEKYPRLVQEIADEGHEIGSHSYAHQLVYQQTKHAFKEDLRRSIDVLEAVTGKKVVSYRAPGFSITKESQWAFDELVRSGIEIDCSVFAANRSHGGLPTLHNAVTPFNLEVGEGTLKCLPLNVVKVLNKNFVFSGGGYFRITPFWVSSILIENSDYVMTYFHPRDLDPDQPKLSDMSFLRSFKANVGLKGCENKLRKLITQFEFLTVGDCVTAINWDSVGSIRCGNLDA